MSEAYTKLNTATPERTCAELRSNGSVTENEQPKRHPTVVKVDSDLAINRENIFGVLFSPKFRMELYYT